MTVNQVRPPAFYSHHPCPKIRRVGQMIEQLKPECEWKWMEESMRQPPLTVVAGANVLVAGSSILA